MKGRKLSAEQKEKIGKKSAERWNSFSENEKKAFCRKTHLRKNMSGAEKVFQEIINKNNYPFYFNGNAQGKIVTIIDRKIPDFVHNTEKKVIEIFGDYWHRGENPQDRIDLFKESGYDCIVIWASELPKSDFVLNKMKSFIGEKKC
jgi:very-short-patch-repair endonuclease